MTRGSSILGCIQLTGAAAALPLALLTPAAVVRSHSALATLVLSWVNALIERIIFDPVGHPALATEPWLHLVYLWNQVRLGATTLTTTREADEYLASVFAGPFYWLPPPYLAYGVACLLTALVVVGLWRRAIVVTHQREMTAANLERFGSAHGWRLWWAAASIVPMSVIACFVLLGVVPVVGEVWSLAKPWSNPTADNGFFIACVCWYGCPPLLLLMFVIHLRGMATLAARRAFGSPTRRCACGYPHTLPRCPECGKARQEHVAFSVRVPHRRFVSRQRFQWGGAIAIVLWIALYQVAGHWLLVQRTLAMIGTWHASLFQADAAILVRQSAVFRVKSGDHAWYCLVRADARLGSPYQTIIIKYVEFRTSDDTAISHEVGEMSVDSAVSNTFRIGDVCLRVEPVVEDSGADGADYSRIWAQAVDGGSPPSLGAVPANDAAVQFLRSATQ